MVIIVEVAFWATFTYDIRIHRIRIAQKGIITYMIWVTDHIEIAQKAIPTTGTNFTKKMVSSCGTYGDKIGSGGIIFMPCCTKMTTCTKDHVFVILKHEKHTYLAQIYKE